jgi:protein AaeX
MIGELDFYGLLISPLLPLTVAALIVCAVLRRLLAAIGFYRLVWHRALFDLALLVIVLGGLVAATAGWNPT